MKSPFPMGPRHPIKDKRDVSGVDREEPVKKVQRTEVSLAPRESVNRRQSKKRGDTEIRLFREYFLEMQFLFTNDLSMFGNN